MPRTENWLRPQGETYLITVESHVHIYIIRLVRACFCFQEKGCWWLFPLPQSLSIRSRAANKSCSENRTPSFSTASSETVSPQRSKAGRGWPTGPGGSMIRVSRVDHVVQGKRAERNSHGFQDRWCPVWLGICCKRSRMTFRGKSSHRRAKKTVRGKVRFMSKSST